ncbi:MAG: FAD-dependent oxidoreductase [Chloroflexi bacterium]|nr:FAD-dependent oxidoreductase [Chloroflexota bacterium]
MAIGGGETDHRAHGGHSQMIIVGSGPAGLTAAIYAARANLEPIVIGGSAPGGQLMLTSDVENFPGFPEGVQGPELMARMRDQAERFRARLVDVDVDRVDLSGPPYRLWAGGATYTADSVVVASGASALWLGLDSETRLRGRGVSACATCDGFFFKGKRIAVVGRGATAPGEAPIQTRLSPAVLLLHRRDQFRGSRIMQQRAIDHPGIDVRFNTEVAEVLGDQVVTGLRLRDTTTGREWEEPVGGLFIAIGYRPNTEVFRDWLAVDEAGYLEIVGEAGSARDGVFIAGDVHDHHYRQAITAAADGCKAAMDAERWLEATSATPAAAVAASLTTAS